MWAGIETVRKTPVTVVYAKVINFTEIFAEPTVIYLKIAAYPSIFVNRQKMPLPTMFPCTVPNNGCFLRKM